MTHEDLTLSEDLPKRQPFHDWVKENKFFLSTIGILSLISLSLLIQNQWPSKPLPLPPEPPPSILHPPSPPRPRKIISYPVHDPLREIRHRFENGEKPDQAIYDLLTLSESSSDASLREKASVLAKEFHSLKKSHEDLKKIYLEGYILMHTDLAKACEKWREVIRKGESSFTYTRKAKERLESNCQN